MCCPQTVDEDTKDDEDVHMVNTYIIPSVLPDEQASWPWGGEGVPTGYSFGDCH